MKELPQPVSTVTQAINHQVRYGKKVLRKFSIDILTADKPQVKENFQKYI